MGTPERTDREFWQCVLDASGFTAIPRWTAPTNPRPAVAEYEAAIPGEPTAAELLAAHARVIGALSGAEEVLTGFLPEGHVGAPLPCRLVVGGGSWRELIEHAGRTAADVAAHAGFPVAELAGDRAPLFEVVLGADQGGLPEGVVLWVSVAAGALRLRYRTEALDVGHVARIGGYYLSALRMITVDPDAEHARHSLPSAEELDFQLDGLAGPERELPDRRFHELFEEQVRRTPKAVAAIHRDQRWTYAELNRRANRIGNALLARGLSKEDAVAVVTERNLDWMAAVLAIFKAGGAYLPIEPHFPSGRIATMLSRAGCALAVTERGSTDTLAGALQTVPEVRKLYLDEVYSEDHDDSDLGVPVGSDQLAYIYFTSGSTGEPKGAMCEHAGMLNHLYAKIDDLGITGDQVVAQIASQCFDISLWQLVSALLVGGCTLIVELDVILDVQRFVDLVWCEVDVIQLVPSYLEVLLSHMEEHPADPSRLRCVSVTGEALKKELTERWFAAFPHIKLANAYGLTETSDDTNHEVMDRTPERDRVPLGRAINNVRVYVVDEYLNPVPLGSPGEIVFSGICVGRGYINDLERTAAAFLTDPHRPGQRLYRSGDFGRWLPEGKLEFLGRRDAQVKIRGFRIEIGEIENKLLGVAGVRDAAVVVAEWPDQGKTLVAFYATPDELIDAELRAYLSAALPEYMVPSHFHWLEKLPLTENRKIDKKRLAALAATLGADSDDGLEPLRTPTERRVAAEWAEVLGVAPEKVGRSSHFFDSGGTSLSAVRLIVALKRAVSLTELTRYPVLADLASFIDGERAGKIKQSSAEDCQDCGRRQTKGMAVLVSAPDTVAAFAGLDGHLEEGKPAVVQVTGVGDAAAWAAEHRDALRRVVAQHGAVLVRGLGLHDAAEAGKALKSVATELMAEREAFAPRSTYEQGVYSSSKWPPNQPMCMHHELSYALEFPGMMLFACLSASADGGVTAVADAARVLEALPTDLVERFEREGWLLTRSYHNEIGMPWSEAFGTADQVEVEEYCAANGISFEWTSESGLRTSQWRSAVISHPVHGAKLWFNQIAFLNEWTMAPEVREYLVDVLGRDGLPFSTSFGNGDEITEDIVQLINKVYDSVTLREPWQAGDLMLVDNLRMAHSREPYYGPREVLVAMGDPVKLAACSPTVNVAADQTTISEKFRCPSKFPAFR